MSIFSKKPLSSAEKVERALLGTQVIFGDADAITFFSLAWIDILCSLDEGGWEKLLDECSPTMHHEVQRLMKIVNNTSKVND